MQEKIILTERKSRRISVGKFLLNVNDLQVALAGGRADKSAIIYAVATEKLKVKGKQISPRRLRAKYTHRTNLSIYTLCISRLHRAFPLRNCHRHFLKGILRKALRGRTACKQRDDLTYHRRKGDT